MWILYCLILLGATNLWHAYICWASQVSICWGGSTYARRLRWPEVLKGCMVSLDGFGF